MSEIILVKKVNKNGFISETYHKAIVDALLKGKLLILPIDGIYVIATLYNKKNYNLLKKLPLFTDDVVLSVSNFTMLEKFVKISKKDHDFLHRIWPGHVTVVLESNKFKFIDTVINTIMPNTSYIQKIIEELQQPIIYMNMFKSNGRSYNKKNELRQAFSNLVDVIVIIEEYSNHHLNNTKIDIRNNELKILQEGKVFSEEITSLYFLGADDAFI